MDKTFSQLYTDLDGGFTPLNFLFPNLPLESYRKRDRAQKKMSDFYVDIIRRRKASNGDVRPIHRSSMTVDLSGFNSTSKT
jgi:sterol 14-demethylase